MSDALKQYDDNSKDESPLTTALESHLVKWPDDGKYVEGSIVVSEGHEIENLMYCNDGNTMVVLHDDEGGCL